MISKKIRAAARGQECTAQILGTCNGDNGTTILAHFPHESHGMGIKATDFSGGFVCSGCHDAIDRRTHSAELEEHREWYLRRSTVRTFETLYELGMIIIK